MRFYLPRRPLLFQKRVPYFQRLQTRLTFSFVLANVAATATVVVLLLVLAGYLVFFSPFYPPILHEDVKKVAQEAARFIQPSGIQRRELQEWLEQQRRSVQRKPDNVGTDDVSLQLGLDASPRQAVYGAVTDERGVVIVGVPEASFTPGVPLLSLVAVEERGIVDAALRGETDAERLSLRGSGPSAVTVAPIYAGGRPENGRRGLLFVRIVTPFSWVEFSGRILSSVLPTALVSFLFSAIVGTIFGYLLSRRFTRRLASLTEAANAWSSGEFAVQAPSDGQDEIALLSARLNRMATELRDLVALRQDIATLDERHRLARDLHDTVKQQVFALTMQLGAARSLLSRDPVQAGERLMEAEKLARQAQQELTTILQELRPSYQERQSLPEHLRDLAQSYERQTGMLIHFCVAPTLEAQRFSPRIELALLRIAQEALSNAARHSGASRIEIALNEDRETGQLELSIIDNGHGFDAGAVQKARSGMGLTSMRERAEALPEGRLELTTQIGNGTRLRVVCRRVPLSFSEQEGRLR